MVGGHCSVPCLCSVPDFHAFCLQGTTDATLGGWTTLHNACRYGCHEIAKDLLALGMDPSVTNVVSEFQSVVAINKVFIPSPTEAYRIISRVHFLLTGTCA